MRLNAVLELDLAQAQLATHSTDILGATEARGEDQSQTILLRS